jgi:hypothetical protein
MNFNQTHRFNGCSMQLHNNGSSKFTSGRSFSISSKISSLGGWIVTEVGDGIMINSHNRTQHNSSSFCLWSFWLKNYIYINLRNIFSKYERKTKCTMELVKYVLKLVLQVKKNWCVYTVQGHWNNKKARGANAYQGHLYTPTIMCWLANESLIVHVPLTIAVLCFSNKVYSRNYNCTNTLNQVTFKFTPHVFAQNWR